jgi:glycosyltransferase involved in cell wall biosynthesis
MKPTVSVITPSFNQGQFIEETILSIKKQDYPHIEHIVVDGGSSDDTLALLRKYDKDITWVSEPDNGQTHAINKGIRMARGDIITYLNSDDIVLPCAVSAVVEAFTRNPEVDFIYGDYMIIDTRGNHLLSRKTIGYDKNILLYGRALISQPASFFRRNVIDRIGYFDESYDFCMDIEFWLRAVVKGIKFHRINYSLAAQRLHHDAKTMTIRWKLDDQHRKILNKNNLLWFKKHNILNKKLFSLLKFIYRSKAAMKRIIQHGDYRILAASGARKRATQR